MLTLGSCGTSSAIDQGDGAFAVRVNAAIADAKAAGADESQLAILTHAASTGEVTYDENERAMYATFECFDAAGIQHERDDDGNVAGFRTPNYNFFVAHSESDVDARLAVGDECIARYSEFVSMLYQTQPAASAAQEQLFTQARPLLVACLAEHDVAADKEASPNELVMLALELHAGPQQAGDGPDCMMEAGLVT